MVTAQDFLQKSRLATALWFLWSATGTASCFEEELTRKPDRRVTGNTFAGICCDFLAATVFCLVFDLAAVLDLDWNGFL